MASLHMLLQVRNGEVAERVATEGVMLQYAVDAKLDELLAAVWTALTGGGRGAAPIPCVPAGEPQEHRPGGCPQACAPAAPHQCLHASLQLTLPPDALLCAPRLPRTRRAAHGAQPIPSPAHLPARSRCKARAVEGETGGSRHP